MEKVTVNGIDMCARRAVLQVWKTGGVLKPDASPLITGCFAEAALSQTLKCRYDVKFCAKYREKEDITTLNCLEQRRIIKRRTQYISFATIHERINLYSTINHKDMDGFLVFQLLRVLF